MGKYPCGSFFAQAYDSQDREGLLSGEGAEIYIKNCLMMCEWIYADSQLLLVVLNLEKIVLIFRIPTMMHLH